MMKQLGIIEPSNSEWSSPLVIVPKKDGSLRVCVDFRKLNAQSRFDAYPMPRIDDLLERIGQARYITTLDLCKGYWQVSLDLNSKPYTAFRTPVGTVPVYGPTLWAARGTCNLPATHGSSSPGL